MLEVSMCVSAFKYKFHLMNNVLMLKTMIVHKEFNSFFPTFSRLISICNPPSEAEHSRCTFLVRHMSTFGHDKPHWVTTDGNSCHCAAESEGARANVSVEWENYSLPWGGEARERGGGQWWFLKIKTRGNVHISVTVLSCYMLDDNMKQCSPHIHV